MIDGPTANPHPSHSEEALTTMTLLTNPHHRKLVKVIMGAEKERAGKLTDSQLVEEFVGKVLNGLETGSYEEALADEITDRFSAAIGIETLRTAGIPEETSGP